MKKIWPLFLFFLISLTIGVGIDALSGKREVLLEDNLQFAMLFTAVFTPIYYWYQSKRR